MAFLNNDDKPDLFVDRHGGSIEIYLNNRSGHFVRGRFYLFHDAHTLTVFILSVRRHTAHFA